MSFTQLPINTVASSLTASQGVDALQKAHDMPSAGAVKKSTIKNGRKSIVLIGDSITNQNWTEDTTIVNLTNIGFFNHANYFLNNVFDVVNEAGVSGESTGEILTRFQDDVVDYNPQYVMILAGTNDCIANSPLSTITSNIEEIINLSNRAGIIPILGVPYLSSSMSEQVSQELIYWIKNFASVNGIYCADFAGALNDPESSEYPYTLPNVTYDGLHPNFYGAYLMGRELAAVLDNERRENNFFPSNINYPSNLVLNSVNKGVGGSIPSGVAPNDVSVFSTVPPDSTLMGSIVPNGNRRNFKISVTGSTSFDIFVRYAVDLPSPDKSYTLFVEIIDATATELRELSGKLRLRDGSTTQLTSHSLRTWALVSNVPAFKSSGIIETRPIRSDSNTDGAIVDIVFNCESGSLTIGRVALIESDIE